MFLPPPPHLLYFLSAKHEKNAQNETLVGWWNSLVRSVVARDGIWQWRGPTTLAELQTSTSHEMGEET